MSELTHLLLKMILMLAVVAGIALLGVVAFAVLKRAPPTSAILAQANKERSIIIDVRSVREFEAGPRVDGAINVPCTMRDATAIARAAADGTLPRDRTTPILVHCAVGGRSAVAKRALEAAGYSDVVNSISVKTTADALKQAR